MPNHYFQFQKFRIDQQQSGMKVTTDACLFGAWVASEIKTIEEPKHILDIGTGTGLLSLMLAQVTNKSLIESVEINDHAFEEAHLNFKQSNWNDRLKVHHTAIQDYKAKYQYDLIIANPPFFTQSQKGFLANKNQALHATNISMEELLVAAQSLIADNGCFYLLYPEKEMKQFIDLAKERFYLKKLVTVRNKTDGAVFRYLAAFQLQKEETVKEEIIIKRPDGKYTDPFWKLLKMYYLEYNNPSML